MASSKIIESTYSDHYTVRCMKESELDEVLDIMLEKKTWIVRRDKIEMLFHTVKDSIFVMIDSSCNKILGCLMVTPAHNYDVVIGKMIVSTEYRGKSLGSQFMKSVVDRCLKSGKTLSLFSERDSFYEKLGFRKCHPPCAGYNYFITPDAHLIDTYGKANPLEQSTHICSYSNNIHLDEVVSYDAKDEGYENRTFMNLLMCTNDAAMVAVNKDNQSIVGYTTAIFAPVEKTLIICGMKADSDIIAFWLFRAILQEFPDLNEVRLASLRREDPFLTQFGMINSRGGAQNRLFLGEGDIAICHKKSYAAKGLDFTY